MKNLEYKLRENRLTVRETARKFKYMMKLAPEIREAMGSKSKKLFARYASDQLMLSSGVTEKNSKTKR